MFKKLVVGLAMLLMVGCAGGTMDVKMSGGTATPVAQETRLFADGSEVLFCGDRVCFYDGACVAVVQEATGKIAGYDILIQFLDVDDNSLADTAILLSKNPEDGFWYPLSNEQFSADVAMELVLQHNLKLTDCTNA